MFGAAVWGVGGLVGRVEGERGGRSVGGFGRWYMFGLL